MFTHEHPNSEPGTPHSRLSRSLLILGSIILPIALSAVFNVLMREAEIESDLLAAMLLVLAPLGVGIRCVNRLPESTKLQPAMMFLYAPLVIVGMIVSDIMVASILYDEWL